MSYQKVYRGGSSDNNNKGNRNVGLNDASLYNTPYFTLEGLTSYGRIVDVYDGDTITVALPLISLLMNELPEQHNNPHHKSYLFKCRLKGIDTPEKRTRNTKEKKAAQLATEYFHSLLNEDGMHYFELGEFDKYGRLLVTVYKSVYEVKSLNQQMIESGYAYQYEGDKKKSFSDWFKLTNLLK